MKELYKKLAKIQGLGVKKNADNPFFKSKYQNLDEIVRTLNPLLHEHGLLVFHYSIGKTVYTKVVEIETQQDISSSFDIPDLSDIQKIGGAITYAKRYNLGQLFNIVTDEDDDGNTASKAKSEDDDKDWYTDEEFQVLIASGKLTKEYTAKQVVTRLREKYKVAKKYEAQFEKHINSLK